MKNLEWANLMVKYWPILTLKKGKKARWLNSPPLLSTALKTQTRAIRQAKKKSYIDYRGGIKTVYILNDVIIEYESLRNQQNYYKN